MKSKAKLILGIILTICIVCGYCIYTKVNDKTDYLEFNTFIKQLSISRDDILKKTAKVEDQWYGWFKDGEEEFSEAEINQCVELNKKYYGYKVKLNNYDIDCDDTKIITKEQALQDVDKLFRLLRYNYACYGYFGGDTKFNEVKAVINEKLQEKDTIRVSDLNNILNKNLVFVKDKHFVITSTKIINNYKSNLDNYSYVGEDDFFKDESGYYRIVANKHQYLVEVEKDKDVDKYIKPTISDKGNIVYKLYSLDEYQTNGIITRSIQYKEDDVLEKDNIKMYIIQGNDESYSESGYDVQNKVPISTIRSFYKMSQTDELQDQFASTAIKMKEYPVSIIDLRGNIGGYPDAGYKWIENFTGQVYQDYSAKVFVNSIMIKRFNSALGHENNSSVFKYVRNYSDPVSKIKNDKLVFVLIDKNVASAGELFVEALRACDNVVLVGTNTSGARIGSSGLFNKLDNSGIITSFGNNLSICSSNPNIEYSGFEPDIVVDSKNALSQVQKLIKYYKLNK